MWSRVLFFILFIFLSPDAIADSTDSKEPWWPLTDCPVPGKAPPVLGHPAKRPANFKVAPAAAKPQAQNMDLFRAAKNVMDQMAANAKHRQELLTNLKAADLAMYDAASIWYASQ
jgi:hypothetical protein